MGIQHTVRSLAGLAVLLVLATCTMAGEREVKVTKTWSGSVENADLAKSSPKYILDAEGLGKLWRHWGLEGQPPEVDFSNEIVLVATARGSLVRLTPKLDDATGNLKVMAIATADFGPGFRYVIGTVNRKGIKSVEGTPLN